ncbi:hypothetical protein AAFF_G00347780 [Aldrovandia affinis]|uniref:Uncharacterized protein n=1 Tax=Aldrovandia affinis TaxID=143900 RepID=A0AAD7SJP6_9TELE|nr:hypothetical protein AAFF_G00347780 [Aldrovandia affinis]
MSVGKALPSRTPSTWPRITTSPCLCNEQKHLSGGTGSLVMESQQVRQAAVSYCGTGATRRITASPRAAVPLVQAPHLPL